MGASTGQSLESWSGRGRDVRRLLTSIAKAWRRRASAPRARRSARGSRSPASADLTWGPRSRRARPSAPRSAWTTSFATGWLTTRPGCPVPARGVARHHRRRGGRAGGAGARAPVRLGRPRGPPSGRARASRPGSGPCSSGRGPARSRRSGTPRWRWRRSACARPPRRQRLEQVSRALSDDLAAGKDRRPRGDRGHRRAVRASPGAPAVARAPPARLRPLAAGGRGVAPGRAHPRGRGPLGRRPDRGAPARPGLHRARAGLRAGCGGSRVRAPGRGGPARRGAGRRPGRPRPPGARRRRSPRHDGVCRGGGRGGRGAGSPRRGDPAGGRSASRRCWPSDTPRG